MSGMKGLLIVVGIMVTFIGVLAIIATNVSP